MSFVFHQQFLLAKKYNRRRRNYSKETHGVSGVKWHEGLSNLLMLTMGKV